jgi:hypothetical protein
MGVSGQRHAPAALLPQRKGPPVPIVQEAGWAPEPVWTQRLEEKSFAPAGDRSVNERITYYRKRWKDHINRMEGYRLPKQIRKYKPKGKRDVDRPMKRWDYKYKICEIVKVEQANCQYLAVEKKKKFNSKVLYSMCRKLANCGQR